MVTGSMEAEGRFSTKNNWEKKNFASGGCVQVLGAMSETPRPRPASVRTARGLSSASLQSHGGFGILSGNLSEALSSHGNVKIKRSGFSGFRTAEGLGLLDLEPFDGICLRLKGDGRCYVSNLRTENWVGGLTEAEDNTWQAFIFAPQGEWCELQIPFSRYLPTWKGKVICAKTEMNPARITGIGFSVTSAGGPKSLLYGPGPFRLELDWIKAFRAD